YVEPEMIPFALNTPFTFIKSASGTHLSKVDFMSEEEADRRISTLRQSRSNALPFRPNVVVIILESFSSEFTAAGPGPSYTPFLDSLMKEGTGFPEAFANGRKSIEGLPSILAGIPALSDQPFISSVYAGNRIDALPALLASEGYHTSFFHGVDKGTMGFDDFCGLAGIKHYYGRESYEDIHGEEGYDGTWGIFDHRYFAYFSSEISHFPEPFFTTLFSVSSHHPYRVPDDYQDRVIAGDHPLQTVISYTDIALRELFKRLEKEDFYRRTLFVITADHTGTPVSEQAHTPKGAFTVPILYFMPGQTLPTNFASITQHIDVFPSILDLTVSRKNYFCFGTSVFSADHRNGAISYTQGVYQWITKEQVIQHTLESMTQKGQEQNAVRDENLLDLEAFIQQYNNHLINNTMTYRKNSNSIQQQHTGGAVR
ncbi:MAG: LTA synthase family protein, partial [Flavobacteriales bacterium]|nr:LTA synthase family protein [Flavobacteriales bacterium]